MPQTALGNRGLNYEHDLGSGDWKNGYDSNWVLLDAFGQVVGVATAEPGAPGVGAAYILGSGLVGANWAGDSRANESWVAIYTNVPGQTDGSPWLYLEPREGWSVYDQGAGVYKTWDASATRWIVAAELRRAVTVVGDNGGDYTPGLEQENGVVLLSSSFDQAGGDQFVIPSDASVAYKTGTLLEVWNKSAGAVPLVVTGITFAGGAPASLPVGITRLVKVGANAWEASV